MLPRALNTVSFANDVAPQPKYCIKRGLENIFSAIAARARREMRALAIDGR